METLAAAINILSILAIPLLVVVILLFGIVKKVKLYETFIEGAKEGFQVGVRIIPYLVAMLTAIGIFRTSGAMDILSYPGFSLDPADRHAFGNIAHGPDTSPFRERGLGGHDRNDKGPWTRFPDRPHGGGHDGQRRDYLLCTGYLFRFGGNLPHPPGRSGGPYRRWSQYPDVGLDRPIYLWLTGRSNNSPIGACALFHL